MIFESDDDVMPASLPAHLFFKPTGKLVITHRHYFTMPLAATRAAVIEYCTVIGVIPEKTLKQSKDDTVLVFHRRRKQHPGFDPRKMHTTLTITLTEDSAGTRADIVYSVILETILNPLTLKIIELEIQGMPKYIGNKALYAWLQTTIRTVGQSMRKKLLWIRLLMIFLFGLLFSSWWIVSSFIPAASMPGWLGIVGPFCAGFGAFIVYLFGSRLATMIITRTEKINLDRIEVYSK